MHSKNYEKIKKWYDQGLWTKDQLKKAVVKGQITSSEYEEITGEPYSL